VTHQFSHLPYQLTPLWVIAIISLPQSAHRSLLPHR
jgi:hypothetical protein